VGFLFFFQGCQEKRTPKIMASTGGATPLGCWLRWLEMGGSWGWTWGGWTCGSLSHVAELDSDWT
jgi:hypothetical protein